VRGAELAVRKPDPPVGEAGTDEKELIERARAGDRSAFRDLVRQYEENVYFLALGMTRNHHDAEDLQQEVFLKAYRHLDGFRGEARLGSWLYRIAVNTCLDQRRRKRFTLLRRSIPLEPGGPGFEAVEERRFANPEENMRTARIREEVHRALLVLTPLERSVFVLRHYNEFSIREVADALDRAEGTVKNTLFRALRKLRRELEARRVGATREECP
jgi:RNA polymerase sigma-70 factor (ECF subfamily)